MIAQILLTSILIALMIYVLPQSYVHIGARIVFAMFSLVGIIMIWFPDLANFIAHAIGISRGADLVFYIYILVSMGVMWFVYLRIIRLEQKFVDLVRALSLRLAEDNPRTEPEAGDAHDDK